MLVYLIFCSKSTEILNLLVFFASEFGFGVGDVNIQSGGSFNNGFSFFRAYSFSNFTSPLSIAHHQTVEFVDVVDQEFFEAKMVSASVSGIFVGSITDAWVAGLTAESSSKGTVDTFWSSPAAVSDSNESIDLVSGKLLVSLFQEWVLADSFLGHFENGFFF